MNIKKVIATILIITMVVSTGCTVSKRNDAEQTSAIDALAKEDAEQISAIPGAFIDALPEDDNDALGELASHYDYDSDVEVFSDYLPDTFKVIEHAISLAEITECAEPEIDEDGSDAKMDVTFSYIDMAAFASNMSTDYMKIEEYYSALDEYEEREEKTITLKFICDEDEGPWLLTRASARKIVRLVTSGAAALPDPVSVLPSEAEACLKSFMNDMALYGYSDLVLDQDPEEYRVYDNVLVRGEGEATQEAVQNFVAAYMSYVMAHDYEVELGSDPYDMTITGSAPSSDELYQCFCTDDFRTRYYMNLVRCGYLGMDLYDMWDDQSALIYDALTEAIPNCSPEDYTLQVSVNRNGSSSDSLTILGDIITEPYRGIFEFEHGATFDQIMSGYSAAAEQLYEIGEIDEQLYEAIMATLTPEFFGYFESDNVSPSGHPDQAIGVYEQVPEFCTDGSLVYGYSNTDENGFWMHYSKEPGWLGTVGYYIDDNGIWITTYFDRPFAEGTNLVVDWWIDDVQVVDTEIVTIEVDGTSAIEVYLPSQGFPSAGEYEMRLWEEDHTHVIACVTLTNEMSHAAT